MGAQEEGGKGLIYEFPGFRLGLPTPTNTGAASEEEVRCITNFGNFSRAWDGSLIKYRFVIV
jgi:hypothetical protein